MAVPSLTEEFLIQEYVHKKRSFGCIAKQFCTYPNKIRRAALNFGIQPRDKSRAQKAALKKGRHPHPTKARNRSEMEREKICESVAKSWRELTPQQYESRVRKAKDQWERMSEEEKTALRSAAAEAVRKTSKEGSKLEKFLLNKIRESGVKAQFHKKNLIKNERLEVDMFLPDLKTAIEVDGPSHFFPIWGEESLARNLRADSQKTGLLITSGFAIIRVKHTSKHLSKKQMRDLWGELSRVLERLKKRFPSKSKRLIEIEV